MNISENFDQSNTCIFNLYEKCVQFFSVGTYRQRI